MDSGGKTFEEAVSRLETVVRELEDGRLPLEEALALFAEGVELSRLCNRYLAEAEERIAVLIADDKGGLKPFSAGGKINDGS
ncbi:MAG: exodeoxyribonuclease VII small subunit [Peptococcaceae bacterium]|jgi:exodeoxyribonuclease VII small subunit|nr:MAG: exodeoxyribonuclease VII small subunit [Peptococcaceae bacterium]